MKLLKYLLLAGAALLCISSSKAQPGRALTNLPSFKPFIGLGYSPFQGSQSPNYGVYPSVDAISFDLTNNLIFMASEIRTFGMDGTQSNIAGLCNAYGLKCFPCAYLNPDDPVDNSNELNALIAVANNNYPTTRGLVVGTEPLRIGYDPNLLVSNIDYVRMATHTNFPIGTADVPNILYQYPAVVDDCDFVMINLHPYWAEMTITDAVAWTFQQWQSFTNSFRGKKVLIGETGWPTAGTNVFWSDPNVVLNVENQRRYLSEFVAMANSNDIEYFIFDYRDENWKGQEGYGTAEENWGMLDTNSVQKSSYIGYRSANFSVNLLSATSNSVTLAVPTYENNPYTLYGTANLLSGFGNPVTNFIGAPGANQTLITTPTSGQPVGFFKAAQNF